MLLVSRRNAATLRAAIEFIGAEECHRRRENGVGETCGIVPCIRATQPSRPWGRHILPRGMGATLKRDELDRVAERYALDAAGVSSMLDVADARPGAAALREFFSRCARYGGILSLASALVFFVAANWSRIAVFGRFALLELVLLALMGVAVAKPPPQFAGRSALFLAFVATGALLALFGQTYQTGADVYELFLTWSLLGLPLVVLARWSAASAAWVLVFDVALGLYCGWEPRGGLLWTIFEDHHHISTGQKLLFAGALNIILWVVAESLEWPSVPDWVRRLVITCGMAFVTWAGILGIAHVDFGRNQMDGPVVACAYLAMIVVAVIAYWRRRDVYPLALAMTSVILATLVWIPNGLAVHDEALVLLAAVWLIGTSAAAGRVVLVLTRRWREAATPA